MRMDIVFLDKQDNISKVENFSEWQDTYRTYRTHHIKHIKDFVEQVKNIKLEEGEDITSCEVKALFTTVSVDPTINIIKNRLELDAESHNSTSMSINHIITLLELCLKDIRT